MKSVLDNTTREELIRRISLLNEHHQPQWGTMNLFQMLKHCILCEEVFQGTIHVKRSLPGRLFGQTAIKNLLKDETPLKKNSPTTDVVKIKDTSGDVEAEKNKWIELIRKYENYPHENYLHWFFGKMTKEQVGKFAYKHADHHLRQFNA